MQEIQTASGQWAVPEHRGQHKAAALEAKNSTSNLNSFIAAFQLITMFDLYSLRNQRKTGSDL